MISADNIRDGRQLIYDIIDHQYLDLDWTEEDLAIMNNPDLHNFLFNTLDNWLTKNSGSSKGYIWFKPEFGSLQLWCNRDNVEFLYNQDDPNDNTFTIDSFFPDYYTHSAYKLAIIFKVLDDVIIPAYQENGFECERQWQYQCTVVDLKDPYTQFEWILKW